MVTVALSKMVMLKLLLIDWASVVLALKIVDEITAAIKVLRNQALQYVLSIKSAALLW